MSSGPDLQPHTVKGSGNIRHLHNRLRSGTNYKFGLEQLQYWIVIIFDLNLGQH